MYKNLCKAKDPNNCRYHSAEEYNTAFQNLLTIQQDKNNVNTLEDIEEHETRVRQAVTEIDATQRGYRGLLSELTKAEKLGDKKLQYALSYRLKNVDEYRANIQ